MNIPNISTMRWFMVWTLLGVISVMCSVHHAGTNAEHIALRFIGIGMTISGLGYWKDYETPVSGSVDHTGKVLGSTARFNIIVFLLKVGGGILMVMGIWKFLNP